MQELHSIALVVRDYDEALAFYVGILGFDLLEDTNRGNGKRWVVVRPPGGRGARLLLAKAKGAEQEATIGNQTGGRVFLFLHTDSFEADVANLVAHEVEIVRGPVREDFGDVVVFKDLYGNKWDLIGPEIGS